MAQAVAPLGVIMKGCYLLCFHNADGTKAHLAHAGHYIGYSSNITGRIYYHLMGQSRVSIINAVLAQGLLFRVARVWVGADRSRERRLKNQGGATRICPICNGRLTIEPADDESVDLRIEALSNGRFSMPRIKPCYR